MFTRDVISPNLPPSLRDPDRAGLLRFAIPEELHKDAPVLVVLISSPSLPFLVTTLAV
jgi:hypothetical protein